MINLIGHRNRCIAQQICHREKTECKPEHLAALMMKHCFVSNTLSLQLFVGLVVYRQSELILTRDTDPHPNIY